MDHLRFAPAAALAAAALFGFALATPALADPPPLHGHSPVQPHRNKDGSLQRGPNFELITGNWAGYAVANFQTGQKYLAAKSSWTVAAVTFGDTTSEDSDEYAASWVGVGGYCTDPSCAGADNSLIQLGTQSEVAQDGTATYSAWYEMLPQAPVAIPLAISPGDKVTASLECVGACVGNKQPWALTMTNHSTHQSWSRTVAYSSSLLSAEWIEEAPVLGGILPLADFTIAPFTATSANGDTPTMTSADNGILMGDPWGQIATISEPGAANAFDVCWGFFTLTPCPTP
jgi:hypothetical protein